MSAEEEPASGDEVSSGEHAQDMHGTPLDMRVFPSYLSRFPPPFLLSLAQVHFYHFVFCSKRWEGGCRSKPRGGAQ